jgi:hypothetical protein
MLEYGKSDEKIPPFGCHSSLSDGNPLVGMTDYLE